MELEQAVQGLASLAHEGRLRAFRMLVAAGKDGLPAGEIAGGLDVPPNTLTANLNVLRAAGLVQVRRAGRSRIYSARFEPMASLLGFLVEDCCAGAPAVCAPLAEVFSRAACCASDEAGRA